ncbi:MAG TPA: flagellar basal-body MS-ring/collar protein FliF [Terriglobia bacterium]|nr:flagellar basal-body MS-ring/collar protein FliF [Terriglobia bacterium]
MAIDRRQIVTQATIFLRGLTARQKIILGTSLVAVAGVVWLFVVLAGKGDYKPLYSGLSPEDTQTISQRLAAQNIPFQLSSDRTSLSVPADQIDKVRLQMASAGLPVTGRLGFELFDKPNWAGSDFYEQVNYQRALEGELERTIESLSDVQGARVHLVLPKESLFTEREREAKAAVLVKLRGPRLSEESINSITYLVASSVDNLKPENVTVVDADGRVPISNHGSDRQTGSRGDADFETALTQKLTATLTPVLGVEHVRSSVSVDFETASNDTTQETYDPNGVVALTSQTSSEQLRDGASEGIPGTPSNVPQAKVADASKAAAGAAPNLKSPQAGSTKAEDTNEGDGATQGERTESKTFAVSRTLRHTLQPPGSIKRISAVVLVDDAVETKVEDGNTVETRRKRTPDELKQIQDLASAAIGIDPARGDHLTVEGLSFLGLPKENPAEPTLADQVLPVVQQWSTLIRYGVLLSLFALVYLLILRPLKKQMVITLSRMPRLPRGERPALVGATATGILPNETQEAIQIEPVETAESKRHEELKRSIAKRVEKEPEEASRVIQSWLLDDEGA